jgi:hypothetical protein
MQNLMQGSAHLLQADSQVTKLFCCDSFVLRLLARATCFKFLERFHSHTPFLPNDPPCMDPVHVFEGMSKAGEGGVRSRERERPMGGVCGSASLSGDYSLAMLFGARHCMSRQLSLSQALGLNSGPAPPAFDLAAAGQHMEAIERIKKYFFTFRSIRQQNGAGNRSAATFFWFKWSLDAVSAVMLFKADTTSHLSNNDSSSRKHENSRDAALLLSLSSLVQEVVGLRQSMLFLMEPSAAAALTVIITIVMAQRAQSPAYEDIWKSLFMAVSSAAASSVRAAVCVSSIVLRWRVCVCVCYLSTFLDCVVRVCAGGDDWQRQCRMRLKPFKCIMHEEHAEASFRAIIVWLLVVRA